MKGRGVESSRQVYVFPLLSRKQEAMIGTKTSRIMGLLDGGWRIRSRNLQWTSPLEA